jgi:RNA polymerase sigma-70 factor (ECF subfamily)
MAVDKKQFKDMFIEFYQPLCNYAFSFTKDINKSEDIVQDVFVKLWNNKFSADKNKNLAAYLFLLVRNHSLDILKRDSLGARVTQNYYHFKENEEYLSGDEKNIDHYMMLEKLDKSIKSLPPKCGEVFTLNKIKGLSHNEIAASLGISVKTVEAHMTRAYKLIKSHMILKVVLWAIFIRIFIF